MRAGGWWLVGALAAAPLSVSGQAMIEYTLGVGRAAATAPAMKKAGEASAKTFEKLGQTLGQPGQGGQAGVASSTSKIPLAAEAPKRLGPFLDPVTITAGLTRDELLNRYGDPVMKTIGGVGTLAGETCWYRRATGEHILAEVREGKVAAVSTEAQRKQASSAVVIVQ